jgi:hypothetical protein
MLTNIFVLLPIWFALGAFAGLWSVGFRFRKVAEQPFLFSALCCFGPLVFLLILLDSWTGKDTNNGN